MNIDNFKSIIFIIDNLQYECNANFIELNSNNEIVWHGVVESTLGANFLVRIMKLDNLYPSSFNIEFDNYFGNSNEFYVGLNELNSFSFNIINNGWNEDTYEITITDNLDINYSTTIQVDANSLLNHHICINELFQGDFNSEIELNLVYQCHKLK